MRRNGIDSQTEVNVIYNLYTSKWLWLKAPKGLERRAADSSLCVLLKIHALEIRGTTQKRKIPPDKTDAHA
ncbi:hypothetical protein [Pseudomonas paralactis]|uniref:hypothetical protein n=1 Tax=Pseudomonas paralactis TaxID=1615673 RepID=UPI0018E5F0A9|nr:hypothetical protein [Pseudomonas paralactis]